VPQRLYSVEQVADLLGLHVRTVRNYVRDGRLKAVRIGKQYRITPADVAAFTGTASPPEPTLVAPAEVSAVVRIDDIDPATAARLSTLVMGALQGRSADEPLHVQTVHDEQRATMKIIIVGGLAGTATLLELIRGFTGHA
jgi:excisionase family DNA binding protein